jgi:8-oxo-dGTP pyrophosphatase MutT (NUDIX family)
VAFDLVSDPLIFDMDVHGIPRHGEVPPHDHYDLRFAFVARHRHEPVVSDESHDVAWVSLGELERYTTEPAMLRMRAKWRHRGSQVLNRGE